MKKLAIILIGAPGSGKGTQGALLEKRTKYKRYVMSDLIKKELKPGSELFEKVINQGILLGDSDVFEIFRKHFKSEKNVIIDGIPRTLDQAYWLYGFLMQHGYEIEVLFIKVNEKKLLDRIIKRGRKDDNPKIFKERLETFDKVKKVILEVYAEEIIEVNGDQTIDKVEEDINKKFKLK